MMSRGLPVIAAAAIGEQRIEMTVPEGLTVGEIIRIVLPDLPQAVLRRVRVTLVNRSGAWLVDPARWHAVRPKAGVQIVVRIVPGEDQLRAALTILISVAAIALGQFWAPALAGTFGLSANAWTSIISLGVTLVGNFLLNVLMPPHEAAKEKPTYAISGWRNEYRPDGPVPLVLGRHRYAPPYGAMPYTEVVGDLLYQRALFCVGYGPLALSDLRIGDTPIEEYDECEVEVREGLPSDAPLTLYQSQVIEAPEGAELTRPLPRDDFGEIVAGPTEEIPVIRVTAANAAEAAVIIGFPGGLVSVDKKGRKRHRTVVIRLRQRPIGTSEWLPVISLSIAANRAEAVYRQHRWTLPARGRWEIEITRMTDETLATTISDRSTLVALQSYRPEYPINFDAPLALVAVRVKGTHQLNGTLDRFNLVAAQIAPDWDGAAWVTRESRNPAAAFRRALEGPAVRYPALPEEIDLEALADWAEFCADKGLKYDRIHDFEGSWLDQLSTIAAAGRAAPRHDGRKWSVVIDRPRSLVVDHLNPRNSRGFRWRRPYFTPPDAYRVPFIDASNEFQSGERIVPWPPDFRRGTLAELVGDLAHRAGVTAEVYDDPGNDGYYVKIGATGEGGWSPKQIAVTEELQLPGKIEPDEIWREARRRQYAAIHRPDVITAIQDGAARVATRGDLVMGSWDTLDRTMAVARVVAVRGAHVELDAPVTLVADDDYALRWRVFGADDVIGESIVRPVMTVAGEHRAVILKGDAEPAPDAGNVVHFGRASGDSLPLVIAGIEPGQDMASVLTMQAMVPAIDDLTDAEVPPPWDGRVGNIVGPDLTMPPIPFFTSISSGGSSGGEDGPNTLRVAIAPGSGAAEVARFELDHRLVDGEEWTTEMVPAAAGGAAIDSYEVGQIVALRARAISRAGVAGNYTALITITIGAGNVPIPGALDEDAIQITGKLGHAEIVFATGSDPATVAVRVLRNDEEIALIPVTPLGTFGRIDGDSTRVSLLVNGDFAADAEWAMGSGWSIAGGKAVHAPIGAGGLSQAVTLTTGRWYRARYEVADWAASTVRLQLTGAAIVNGIDRGADGAWLERLQAVAGNTTVAFQAASAFDGAIDSVLLIEETAACLAQGEHTYELEPLNEDDIAGPRSAPRTVIVI